MFPNLIDKGIRKFAVSFRVVQHRGGMIGSLIFGRILKTLDIAVQPVPEHRQIPDQIPVIRAGNNGKKMIVLFGTQIRYHIGNSFNMPSLLP